MTSAKIRSYGRAVRDEGRDRFRSGRERYPALFFFLVIFLLSSRVVAPSGAGEMGEVEGDSHPPTNFAVMNKKVSNPSSYNQNPPSI